ncbi:hypothetical protein FRX31_028719 [Thalictrum thalictroides]|uniref:DUF4283 domain-containing protein n=1 Tax=Thalictrum thalictroides TaxID=46969 RepID=A0A7J6V9P4_THATH|nr:hypothetical protein FRX31_028719 [Thalictrum thalictroides]
MKYVPPTLVEGKPVVHVKSSQFAHLHKKHEKLVVGSFIGRRPGYSYVKEMVNKAWKVQHCIMKAYSEYSFTFEFANEVDKQKVLDMGSFHMASRLFVIQPWKLFHEADLQELKTIPIWVVFKKFPLEIWDEEGLSQVANVVGHPLYMDKLTETMERTSYARVCVEINCNAPKSDPYPNGPESYLEALP